MNDINLDQKGVSVTANPQKSRINVAVAIAVSLICSFAIPFTTNAVIAIITVVVCSVYTVRVAEKKIVSIVALITLFTFFGLSNGLSVISLILAAIVGTGAFSWLISKTDSPFLALIPTISYSAATIITKDWFTSLITLFFVIPSIILAQTYEKKNTRVSSLLRVSLGFLAFIGMAVTLSLIYYTGELRFDIITEFLDSLKESLSKVLAATEVTLVNGTVEKLFSETDAYNIVSMVISLLPALTVILCYALSLFAQNIQFASFSHDDVENGIDAIRRTFIMSPVAAVVFLVSFLVYAANASSYSGALAATVCANLYMILMPGLALMGIQYFLWSRATRTSPAGCSSTLIIMVFIFLLLFSIQSAVLMAACFGAYTAISLPLKSHFQKKE